MKTLSLLVLLACASISYSQILPIDFEGTLTTEDFVDFDGGMATVIPNPYSDNLNNSSTVAKIVRDGGALWAGSKIYLPEYLDFSTHNALKMKVYTTAPVGTVVKFKLEGDANTERDAITTVSNAWEILTWDFTGEAPLYNTLVFMFDFGNIGDGSDSSTFLFDEVEQFFAGFQIDHPTTFEEADINYTTTDFGGNVSSLVVDPEDANNTVVRVIKTDQAATWAGTTIGTPAGFATAVPLSLTESKMTVRVWAPESGTPIRLKVEDSRDPTHTCETETNTTIGGAWEVIEFDFSNQALGTELLSIGVERGWVFNMASIFMNFGTEGASAGAQTYYFDEVRFGEKPLANENIIHEPLLVYPNPTQTHWTLSSKTSQIDQVDLYNYQGQHIQTLRPAQKQVTIDASSLPEGNYTAVIRQDDKIAVYQLVR